MGRLQSSNFAGLVVALMGWVWSNTREKGWIHISWYLMFIYIHLEYSIHRCPSVNSKNWLETGNVPDSKNGNSIQKWSMFHRMERLSKGTAGEGPSVVACMDAEVGKEKVSHGWWLSRFPWHLWVSSLKWWWVEIRALKNKKSLILSLPASMTVHDRWTSKTLFEVQEQQVAKQFRTSMCFSPNHTSWEHGIWRSHSIYFVSPANRKSWKIDDNGILVPLVPLWKCKNDPTEKISWMDHFPNHHSGGREWWMMTDEWWWMFPAKDCKYIVLYWNHHHHHHHHHHPYTTYIFEFGRKHVHIYIYSINGWIWSHFTKPRNGHSSIIPFPLLSRCWIPLGTKGLFRV